MTLSPARVRPLLPMLLVPLLSFCTAPGNDDDDDDVQAADAAVQDAAVLDSAGLDAGSSDTLTPLSCDDFADMSDFVTASSKAKTKFDDDYLVQRIFFTGFDDGSTYGRLSIVKIVAYDGLNGYPDSAGASVDLSLIGQADRDGFLVKHGIDCDSQGHICQTWLWAYSGTASISAIDWSDPVGSEFAGSLSELLFREVTLGVDELPTLVADGCSFTLSSFSWSETVSLAAGDD